MGVGGGGCMKTRRQCAGLQDELAHWVEFKHLA